MSFATSQRANCQTFVLLLAQVQEGLFHHFQPVESADSLEAHTGQRPSQRGRHGPFRELELAGCRMASSLAKGSSASLQESRSLARPEGQWQTSKPKVRLLSESTLGPRRRAAFHLGSTPLHGDNEVTLHHLMCLALFDPLQRSLGCPLPQQM